MTSFFPLLFINFFYTKEKHLIYFLFRNMQLYIFIYTIFSKEGLAQEKKKKSSENILSNQLFNVGIHNLWLQSYILKVSI